MEVVPEDQDNIPKPKIGQRIYAYGVYVIDRGHTLDTLGFPWHEIHPVRYLKVLDTGEEGGNKPYEGELMQGVYDPERLKIVDEENPYRGITGTVVNYFTSFDGDIHIHVELDGGYRSLVRFSSFLPYIDTRLLGIMLVLLAFLLSLQASIFLAYSFKARQKKLISHENSIRIMSELTGYKGSSLSIHLYKNSQFNKL
ncbi:MAG: hypothetical protein ACUVTD_00150 [Nitrososphaerales archaeon]